MLMMCWFYCVDLAWFLYYALGPIIFLCGMFALKRGIANKRPQLRQTAFIMMGVVLFKAFIFDAFTRGYAIKAKLCTMLPALSPLGCKAEDPNAGLNFIFIVGVALAAVSGYALYEAYKMYMPEKELKQVTPDDIHLRFWANLTFCSVVVMVCWQLAPWVGYLTVGCVPKLFLRLTWQHLALLNLGLLTLGFWKLETCAWQFKVADKEKMKYMHNSWTPKDTLWMTVFVYLITIAMSYVAHDIMVRTRTVPEACRPGEVKENKEWNILDIKDVEVYR